MTIQLQSLLIRWFFIVSLLLVGLWVSFDLSSHPSSHHDCWGTGSCVSAPVGLCHADLWLVCPLYYGSAFTGYLLPGLAGGLTAWRTGRITSGLVAGLLTGMCGGLMIWLVAMARAPLLLRVGQHDPQIIRAFEHSGLPDLTTYLVGDTLAGLIVHLWPGFFLGLICGAFGKALTHEHTSSLRRTPLS